MPGVCGYRRYQSRRRKGVQKNVKVPERCHMIAWGSSTDGYFHVSEKPSSHTEMLFQDPDIYVNR